MALVGDGVLPVRPAANANRWASGRLKEQKIHRLAGVGLVPAVSFEDVLGLQFVVGVPASAFRSGRLALRGVRSCLILRLSRLARFGFRSWCRRLAVSVNQVRFGEAACFFGRVRLPASVLRSRWFAYPSCVKCPLVFGLCRFASRRFWVRSVGWQCRAKSAA
jgi:hypothetical protein